VRAAAPFESAAQAPYPDSADRGFLAPAPLLPLSAPELIVQSATLDKGQAHYHLRLNSKRNAPEIYLVFAAADQVEYADLESERGPLHMRLWKWPNGATVLDLKTLNDSAAEVSFSMPAQTAPKLQLLDLSFTLPAEATQLLAARTAETTASQDGDVTLVTRTIHLTVPASP
jgi:hypothetical protein